MRKGTLAVIAVLVLWFALYGMKSVEEVQAKTGSRMAAIEKAVSGQ